MSLTIVYYNTCFCGNHETLHAPRSSILSYLLPGNHFVALGGGAGGVSSGYKYIQIKRPPPFFFIELQCKRGAYNRASTVYVVYCTLDCCMHNIMVYALEPGFHPSFPI